MESPRKVSKVEASKVQVERHQEIGTTEICAGEVAFELSEENKKLKEKVAQLQAMLLGSPAKQSCGTSAPARTPLPARKRRLSAPVSFPSPPSVEDADSEEDRIMNFGMLTPRSTVQACNLTRPPRCSTTPQIDSDQFGNLTDEDADLCSDTGGRSARISIEVTQSSVDAMCKRMDNSMEAGTQEDSTPRPRELACGVANCVIS